jgi:predicted cupin superfamily sugar epimerase
VKVFRVLYTLAMSAERLGEYWIKRLELQPHPEGGHYKEVFRSSQAVNRENTNDIKQACTSIYYLLQDKDYSGFHRILSDEIWYFHQGVPLHVHIIDENGQYVAHELSDTETGNLTVVVKAGLWFAASVPSESGYSLVSCAVAPGFDFNEFEMAKCETLAAKYPQSKDVIERLCRL